MLPVYYTPKDGKLQYFMWKCISLFVIPSEKNRVYFIGFLFRLTSMSSESHVHLSICVLKSSVEPLQCPTVRSNAKKVKLYP